MSDYSRAPLQLHARHAYEMARFATVRAGLADNEAYQHSIEGFAVELQRKAARAWKLANG